MTSSAPLARWWREPWWARASLAGIVVAAITLTGWNLSRGGDFSFYEASARSMSQSWHALLSGAFDPAATVTLDKLSGFAIPQALGIQLFGMATSSIALPQVIEGAVTVVACAVVGLRWGGRGMGLVAAAAAASMPIFVSMFGHPMEDGLLTMALAVALVWWQRAMITARWWPLIVAALFIGIGFQAKMMSAWFILPALALATLIGAAVPRGQAFSRAAALTGTAVVASVSWMIVIALTPAGARPYIDGSTDDNVFAMVFGYNGIDRLVPDAVAGAVGSHAAAAAGVPAAGFMSTVMALTHASGGHAVASGGGETASLTKLLELPLVTQIGWLYPAALVGLALGLWRWWPRRTRPAGRRAARDRAALALFVALGVWTVTAAVFLTLAHVPHTAYVAGLGVQLALLSALAWSEGLRLLCAPRLSARLVLPATLVAQGGWWVFLATESRMPPLLAAAAGAVLVLGIVVGIVAAVRPWHPGSSRAWSGTATILAAALVCGPVFFSAQVLDAARDGSGGDAYVGIPATSHHADEAFTPSAPAPWGGTATLPPALSQLAERAGQLGGGANGTPLVVTDSWALSAPLIVATGQSVLTDGGYSGHVPVFTEAQLHDLVASGDAHLFVEKNGAASTDPVRALVTHDHCTSEQSWDLTGRGEGGEINQVGGFTLYSCT